EDKYGRVKQWSREPASFCFCLRKFSCICSSYLPGSSFFSSHLNSFPLLTHAFCDPSHLLLPICIVFNLFTLADEPLGWGSGRPESAITFPFLLHFHFHTVGVCRHSSLVVGTLDQGSHIFSWYRLEQKQ
ncbi:hypothetical protein BO85DRAFT_507190, partial [Aspergillus piperis CBS 112811]